jgi:uncharacterized protein YqhQ
MLKIITEKGNHLIASPSGKAGRSDSRFSKSGRRLLRRFAPRNYSLYFLFQALKDSFSYGGQAVIEGVMMRGKRNMAVAVRRPDGAIQTEIKPLSGIYNSPITKIPILRGVLLLWDTLGLGWQSLEFSAQVQGEKPVTRGEWLSSILIALVILVGVFFLLPTAAGHWIEGLLTASAGMQTPAWLPAASGNLAEGVIRLILLILYLELVGRMPEIARVFAYHGAEHKTVAAYEAGIELTPESVELYPKEHPRCGTSFLIAVGILGIILFAFSGSMPFGMKILSRLIGIPILVAFGYEYLKLSASVKNKTLARAMAAPGIWTQGLTTREPDRSMLEVAIAALQAVRRADDPPPVETSIEPTAIPDPEKPVE